MTLARSIAEPGAPWLDILYQPGPRARLKAAAIIRDKQIYDDWPAWDRSFVTRIRSHKGRPDLAWTVRLIVRIFRLRMRYYQRIGLLEAYADDLAARMGNAAFDAALKAEPRPIDYAKMTTADFDAWVRWFTDRLTALDEVSS